MKNKLNILYFFILFTFFNNIHAMKPEELVSIELQTREKILKKYKNSLNNLKDEFGITSPDSIQALKRTIYLCYQAKHLSLNEKTGKLRTELSSN